MFEKDPIWFSQVLMTYQDKMYDTEAFLRVSLSTNTQDFQYFNPVNLAISISTPTRTKVCSLNLPNSLDLYNSVLEVIRNPGNTFQGVEPVQILKKYGKDYDLILEFIVEPNNKRRVVRMIIRANETDTVKIVVPFDPIFTTLAFRVKYFQENYETISSTLVNTFLMKEVLTEIRQIPGLIKGIPGSITSISKGVPFTMTEEALSQPPISEEKKKHLEESYQSLDSFLGGNDLSNIKIPDIEEEPVKQEDELGFEIKKESKIEAPHVSGSFLVDSYLQKDIQKLIDFLNVSEMNKAPFLLIKSEFTKNLSFDVLPGLSREQEKSIIYLSKYLASSILKGNTENGSPIPLNLPILQYNPEKFDSKNFDLAIDLLVINGALREYRKRMESKISSDSFANGSISYALFRCYLDIFTFSFIREKDCKGLVGIVSARFSLFDSINFFRKLNNELDAYNLPKLDQKGVTSYIEEMIQKNVFGKNYLEEAHGKLFDMKFCKLPYNNNLSLEQIINELVPVEVMMKIGKKVPKDFPMSDPVREYFEKPKGTPGRPKTTTEKPSEPKKEEKPAENNIQRFARTFRDQIPEKIRDDVMKSLSDGSDRVFEMISQKYPVEEFGDDVIKGLYLWDPKKDPQQEKNYKHFYELYENELMTKELILAKLKKPEETKEKTLFEEIQFDV